MSEKREYQIVNNDWEKIKVKTVVDYNIQSIIEEYLRNRDIQVVRIEKIINLFNELLEQIGPEQIAMLDKQTQDRLRNYNPELFT